MAVTRSGSAVSSASDQVTATLGTPTDGMVVALCSLEHFATETIDSVDMGGQAMIQAAVTQVGSGNHNVVSLWYILDTAIAAASSGLIQQTTSAAVDYEMVSAQVYEGVNQTGGATTLIATNSYASAASPANPALCDLTEVTDGLVCAAYSYESVGSVSWNAAMNELTDVTTASTTSSMADRLSTTSANVDIEATAVATPSRVVMVSAAFAPAGSTSLTQVTHRVYDDGTESGSTALEAQGADLTIATLTPFHVRGLLQAVGTLGAQTFKLRVLRNGDASTEWEDV